MGHKKKKAHKRKNASGCLIFGPPGSGESFARNSQRVGSVFPSISVVKLIPNRKRLWQSSCTTVGNDGLALRYFLDRHQAF